MNRSEIEQKIINRIGKLTELQLEELLDILQTWNSNSSGSSLTNLLQKVIEEDKELLKRISDD